MEIDKYDLYDIRESLRKEYSDEEIERMLKIATFEKGKSGIAVKYATGAIDYFAYTRTLIHSDDCRDREEYDN